VIIGHRLTPDRKGRLVGSAKAMNFEFSEKPIKTRSSLLGRWRQVSVHFVAGLGALNNHYSPKISF
jgi:hypothetical protein